jgi:hypothetical protein
MSLELYGIKETHFLNTEKRPIFLFEGNLPSKYAETWL